jgi:hypothetical protein
MNDLLAAGVLGDGFGAFADGMLGQLSGEQEAHGRLDLPTGDGRALVVVRETRGFGGDALEDVVHEAVHDAHGLTGDAGVRVDLLQHLVDVHGVGLLALALILLLVCLRDVLLGFARFLGGLSTGFRSHCGASTEACVHCSVTLASSVELSNRCTGHIRIRRSYALIAHGRGTTPL